MRQKAQNKNWEVGGAGKKGNDGKKGEGNLKGAKGSSKGAEKKGKGEPAPGKCVGPPEPGSLTVVEPNCDAKGKRAEAQNPEAAGQGRKGSQHYDKWSDWGSGGKWRAWESDADQASEKQDPEEEHGQRSRGETCEKKWNWQAPRPHTEYGKRWNHYDRQEHAAEQGVRDYTRKRGNW